MLMFEHADRNNPTCYLFACGGKGETMYAATAMPKNTLRTNLIRLRNERGWSQAELARRAGVGQSMISRLESGERENAGWTKLAQIARALGVEASELATGSPAISNLAPAGPVVRRIDTRDLLAPYVESHWYETDEPTPAETKWLTTLGFVMVDASLSPAAVAHSLIEQYRAGKF